MRTSPTRPSTGTVTIGGGGRSSGRETACRVAGGAIAQAWLSKLGISVSACTVEIGGIHVQGLDMENALSRPFFSADDATPPLWEERILEVKKAGDSLGGIVRVEAHGVPAGLGEPVFDKLDARLAYALMGVGAVKGVEIGSGMRAATMRGSEHNDPLPAPGILEECDTNAGGILGGISTGQTLVMHAAVKPIPTIGMKQRTIDRDGAPVDLAPGGRHDISAIPRIVPVLKAMVLLVLADFVLLQKRNGLF